MAKSYAETIAAKRNKLLEGSKGKVQRWKPAKGQNHIVVFPAVPAWKDKNGKHGPLSECEPKGVHFEAPNGEFMNCPYETLGDRCHLCEKRIKAAQGKLNVSERRKDEILETCKCTVRYLYNVLDLNDIESGVQLLEAAWSIHEEICAMLLDEDEFDVDSPEAHWNSLRSIKFRNTGKGSNRYKNFKLGKAVPKFITLKKYRSKLYDLKEEATKYIPTYEETVKAYKGLPVRNAESDDGDGDALKGRKKKGKKKSKKKKSKKRRGA